MTDNADQIAYWNEVAGAKWVAQQTKLDRLMAPLSEVLVEAIGARPGERALDVGCGCGDLSLRLSRSCGPSGDILAVDVSRPMLAHAATRGAESGSGAPIAWRHADAMTAAFAADRDLIASRFGVMFFDDRPRAFANLRTAAKPGGRFAFLTWRSCADVEWMQQPLDWISPVLERPANADGEIGPFGLADAKATCALLEGAGFREVRADPVDRMLPIGATLDEACEMLAVAGPAARVLRDADEPERRAALDRIRTGVADRVLPDGGVELAGACWLYQGLA